MAQEMCELFELQQTVNFPTRGDNTLDLVMAADGGTAVPKPGLGTSDHISIDVFLNVGKQVPSSPVHIPSRVYSTAPWVHIKADVKRALVDWDPKSYGDVDGAESALDVILYEVIDKHVKWSNPRPKLPAPWWNEACQDAYIIKCKLFPQRLERKSRYNAALNFCRTVQNGAFAKYQFDLRLHIKEMRKDDKQFWKLAKEIGGIDTVRSSSAPSVDELVDHFANKMSNGKD
jgi:hypothetical protein